MDTRQRNRVDAMADFRDDMKAMMATLSGDFDSRIAELKKLKKEIADKKAVVATVEEANAIMAKARAFEDSLQSAAEQAALNAGTEAKRLEDLAKGQSKHTAELQAREAALAAAEKKFADGKELFTKDAAARALELDRRQDAITLRETELSTERALLAKTQATLTARLEALSKIK